jgi:MSHA biogenesis protein MshK
MRIPIFIIVLGLLAWNPLAAGDPTRPPSPAEIRAWQSGQQVQDTQTTWRLQSVLISEHRRVAIINNQRHQVGDRLAQARIIAIEPGEVTLEQAGERFTLTIASRTQGVRRTSND